MQEFSTIESATAALNQAAERSTLGNFAIKGDPIKAAFCLSASESTRYRKMHETITTALEKISPSPHAGDVVMVQGGVLVAVLGAVMLNPFMFFGGLAAAGRTFSRMGRQDRIRDSMEEVSEEVRIYRDFERARWAFARNGTNMLHDGEEAVGSGVPELEAAARASKAVFTFSTKFPSYNGGPHGF